MLSIRPISVNMPDNRLLKSPRFSGRLEDVAREMRSRQGMAIRDGILSKRQADYERAQTIWQSDTARQAKIIEALAKDVLTISLSMPRPRPMTFRLFDFLERYVDQDRTAYRETYVMEGFLKGKITYPALEWPDMMELFLSQRGASRRQLRAKARGINQALNGLGLVESSGRWPWSPYQVSQLGRVAYDATKDRLIIKSSS